MSDTEESREDRNHTEKKNDWLDELKKGSKERRKVALGPPRRFVKLNGCHGD